MRDGRCYLENTRVKVLNMNHSQPDKMEYKEDLEKDGSTHTCTHIHAHAHMHTQTVFESIKFRNMPCLTNLPNLHKAHCFDIITDSG